MSRLECPAQRILERLRDGWHPNCTSDYPDADLKPDTWYWRRKDETEEITQSEVNTLLRYYL